MPRSSGIFSLIPSYKAVSGQLIKTEQHNPPLEDIAEGLTGSLPRDGSAPMTGNLPMNSNKITNLAAASSPSDAVRFDQVFNKTLADLHGYATTVKSGGTTTLTAASAVYQRFTGSSAHSVVLPDAGTLQLGSFFELHNNDTTGSLTVKSADGSTVMTALAGQIVRLVCVLASGTTAASWKFAVCGFPGVTGSGNAVLNTDPIMARPVLFNPQVQTQSTLVAGTDAQGQGLITGDLVVVITTAANPSGVTLPAATGGRWITVVNRGTNPINVYPALGAAIDAGAANAPVQIAVGAGATFSAKTTTAWESSVQLSKVAFDALSLLNLSSALSGAAGAPYVQGVWHPYNSLAVGDSGTGVIYDFAVNGAVSSIISPDFADGYEYRMIYSGITPNTGTTVAFNLALYRETSAAYATADQIDTITTTSGAHGIITINRPRDTRRVTTYDVTNKMLQGSNGSVGTTATNLGVKHSTAQKVLRAQITLGSGTLASGTITMYRRRVF